MIQRLPQSVINRIAAGEVVQRPAAALKEMLENSIDAGSTMIQITCDEGGLGVLQISDDGSGIDKADLPLLCERFATSKLRSFDDLASIRTFGFRGEALASISHVAKVLVTTMRRADQEALGHGWSARYVDGVLLQEPQPIATTPGTTIRAEDMYYNSAGRRKALGKSSEEYSRIVDVVAKYALEYPHVGFSVKRVEQGKVDAVFPKGSSTLANIKSWFGHSVASHLHSITLQPPLLPPSSGNSDQSSSVIAAEQQGAFRGSGFISDAALVAKKLQLILFVNGRLVDSSSIRRCVEQSYAAYSVNGNKPFVVLSVAVDPSRIDVNVHPTKHEVLLLDEDAITSALGAVINSKLRELLAKQQKASGAPDPQQLLTIASSSPNVATAGHKGVVVAPCTMTRVEPQAGALLPHLVKRDPFKCLEQLKPLTASGEPAAGPSVHVPRLPPQASVIHLLDDDDDAAAAPSSGAEKAEEPKKESALASLQLQLTMKENRADDSDDDDVQAHFKKRRLETTSSADEPSKPLLSPTCLVEALKAVQSANIRTEEANASAVDALQPPAAPVLLLTVAEIRSRFEESSSPELGQLLSRLTLVGVVSAWKFLAQSGTTLYMCDTKKLVRHVAYQRVFTHWRCHPQQVFDPNGSPSVQAMLKFAIVHGDMKRERVPMLSEVGGEGEAGLDRAVEIAWRTLAKWSPMLDDYFGVTINASTRTVEKLPLVLGDAWPVPQRAVPLFLANLAWRVDYSSEMSCFLGIAKEIANTLFGLLPPHGVEAAGDDSSRAAVEPCGGMYDAVRFGLLPRVCATQAHFLPPVELSVDGSLVPVVSVEALYKVFERC